MSTCQYFMVILCSFILMLSMMVQASTAVEHVIEVRGQASVMVQTDNFSLNLAIVQTGSNTDKIRFVVNSKSNQVIKIAKDLGIVETNINSARVVLRVVK